MTKDDKLIMVNYIKDAREKLWGAIQSVPKFGKAYQNIMGAVLNMDLILECINKLDEKKQEDSI